MILQGSCCWSVCDVAEALLLADARRSRLVRVNETQRRMLRVS